MLSLSDNKPNSDTKSLFDYLKTNGMRVSKKLILKAERGDGNAIYTIGRIFYDHQDYEQAMFCYKQAAICKSAEGELGIGYLYNHGLGVDVDYRLAMEWYLRAESKGNTIAQNNIGSLYCFGHGVDQDYEQMIKWFLRSAESGNAISQFNMGHLYEFGIGINVDYQQAIWWYQKSADHGNTNAKEKVNMLKKSRRTLDYVQEAQNQTEDKLECFRTDFERKLNFVTHTNKSLQAAVLNLEKRIEELAIKHSEHPDNKKNSQSESPSDMVLISRIEKLESENVRLVKEYDISFKDRNDLRKRVRKITESVSQAELSRKDQNKKINELQQRCKEIYEKVNSY